MMGRRFLQLFTLLLFVGVSFSAHAGALDFYKNWADIKYSSKSDDAKLTALEQLEKKLRAVVEREPKNTEAIIVLATTKSTQASLIGGMSALSHVKEAKKLFEKAIEQDGAVMDGQAHAILGALYYGVPGWPIAFGDDDEAEKHIKKALELAPNSIDANFFWGDYWLEDGDYEQAKKAFEKALSLKPRASHTAYKAADIGRLKEVKAALSKIESKSSTKRPSRSSNLNE